MPFNFLPWRAKRDQRRQHQFYALLGLAAALTGSIQVWVFANLQSAAQDQAKLIDDQKVQLASQEAILADWTAKQVAIEQAQPAIQDAQAALAVFADASQPIGQWVVDLMAVRPKGVWIEHLQIQPHWVAAASAPLERPTQSVRWQAKLSGHAVLESDPLRYREGLARYFGDHLNPDVSAGSLKRPIAGSFDLAAADTDGLTTSPGLIPFAIEQWIERPRP